MISARTQMYNCREDVITTKVKHTLFPSSGCFSTRAVEVVDATLASSTGAVSMTGGGVGGRILICSSDCFSTRDDTSKGSSSVFISIDGTIFVC
jgi:hypothetical protein